ncbi:hypothetical protein OG21DRAFT_1481889 [Imleria badia]|nr:hypothetical protein OG21DRAFT_1481889 [Imleria badia]
MSPNWQFEDSDSDLDVTRAAWASVYGSRSPSSLGPHYYLDTSSYSAPVNQANFDLVAVQDHSSVFLAPDIFDSNDSDAACTSQVQTQSHVPWISPEHGVATVFTEEPVMHNAPHTSNEVSWSSASSSYDLLPVSNTTNYYPPTLSLDQKIEGGFQTIPGPNAFFVLGIPQPRWGISQPEAGFSSENPPTVNFPAVRIDGSSYSGENIQMVNTEAVQSRFYTASPPSVQHSIPPSEPLCQWKNEDGTVCKKALTRESVPEHLSEWHEIKDISRNSLTTCKWAGCNKSLNRESITRHVREVHMRLKRPSKQVQELYPQGAGHRSNTC